MSAGREEVIARVLRLADHARRGTHLAISEVMPGVVDDVGMFLVSAERKLDEACRRLRLYRDPTQKTDDD